MIYGCEFGRKPMSQGGGNNPGRDHHIKGFSIWMAVGGVIQLYMNSVLSRIAPAWTGAFSFDWLQIIQTRDFAFS